MVMPPMSYGASWCGACASNDDPYQERAFPAIFAILLVAVIIAFA